MKAGFLLRNRTTLMVVQVLLWLVFYLLLLLYTSHKWENPLYGFLNASIALAFYVIAAYVNAAWLLPLFLAKGKTALYAILSVGFLAGLILLRMAVETAVLLPIHKNFYSWQWAHFSFDTITILLAFLFGALLRVFLNYLRVVEQKNELQSKHAEAELNLLKAQVQPHFLFNTLNNIYSLAQSRSEKTPATIARLSELMRYFIDEAPKEKLPLSTEVDFLRNYVELEQIRMLHPVKVEWEVDERLLNETVPPMLLMPFVENVFKHGVDKLRSDNAVCIELAGDEKILRYCVTNTVSETAEGKGSGLQNLRKRLALLYGERYRLETVQQNGAYIANLQIPRPCNCVV